MGAAPADAMDSPTVDVANVAQPPAQAAAAPADTGSARKEPVAVAKIPVPAAAPGTVAKQTADKPVDLVAGFDPSGPVAPQAAGPPMALDAAAALPVRRVAIPPLPRIRPCGGAGPACP